ncbi:hypothetical protein ACIHDR_49410 [Nocardia sp. NPDC052278]|uniref:hypothetical protein n=1 Tax=unclassified Nocardia TaxID=2637762 RepID=UPI0036BD6429
MKHGVAQREEWGFDRAGLVVEAGDLDRWIGVVVGAGGDDPVAVTYAGSVGAGGGDLGVDDAEAVTVDPGQHRSVGRRGPHGRATAGGEPDHELGAGGSDAGEDVIAAGVAVGQL